MNLASTIRMMAEKKGSLPFDPDTPDYAGAAKRIRDYAKKSGGIDKSDMLSIANQLDSLANKSSPKLLARTMSNIGSLDTDVRDKIKQLMKESNCMEALELDEAMVRGKEVFDKTFANKKQADDFAQKNGGRVKQVGRVFYVFKEAKEDDEPASPDEGSMAKQQLEFIEYAADEIGEHIDKGGKFPEWMQNKLATVHDNMQSLHAQIDHEEIEDDEPEEMDEAKRDPSKSGGSGYDLYHKDFSSAMQHAYKYAKDKLGVEIDPKEIDDKVASGPRKPSKGKTNSYRLKGKDGKKGVQIQVANLDDKKFELNMYKESVEMELDENAGLIKDYQGMKAQGKKDSNILDDLMSMPKYKRMSKDQMAKIIGDAKRKGIFKEEVELDEAYKTPSEASAYEAGKKASREGKKYQDNPNKKGTAEFTAWSKGHNEARAKGMKEEVNLDELFESAFEEELAEAKYQVDIKGAGRETVMAKNERDAIAKAAKKMKVHSYKTPDVTVKLMEEEVVDRHGNTKSFLDAIMNVVSEKKELDPVNKKALKKDFDDRKDKDLDNDGDVDDSDEYLHNRRKTVSKEVGKEDGEGKDTPPKKKSPPKKEPEDSPDEEDKEKAKIGKSGKQTKVDTNPSLSEEEMTDAEKDKMEKIKTKLDQKKDEFVKKYGDRAKEVIARTAIKMAKKST